MDTWIWIVIAVVVVLVVVVALRLRRVTSPAPPPAGRASVPSTTAPSTVPTVAGRPNATCVSARHATTSSTCAR